MMAGNDVHFIYKARDGDEAYNDFYYGRVKNNPEETVFQTVADGLHILQNEQAILHFEYAKLKGFFKANPFWNQNIKLFAREKAKYYATIVPKNNPLKPIFQQTVNEIIESGTMDNIIAKWEGPPIKTESKPETMILTIGQVILIYMTLGSAFAFVLLIFGLEGIHAKLLGGRKKQMDQMDLQPMKYFCSHPDHIQKGYKKYSFKITNLSRISCHD
jgi:hypothetical protein